MTARILVLKAHLLNERVSLVVMYATSDYRRPFYYRLEGDGLDVILVNARDARNVPDRKTDVSDAKWRPDLGAHGRMRSKIPELTGALTGRFSSHHRHMAELYLHRIDAHTAGIDALSTRIEEASGLFLLLTNE